ncbi:MAG: hypothetical protein ABH883_01875 [Candidatus Omnitrophota bacterium]
MGFIFSFLLLELTGMALCCILSSRDDFEYSILEFFGLSFFLGAGFIPFQFLLFDLAGVRFSIINSVYFSLPFFAAAALYMFFRRGKHMVYMPPFRNPAGWSLTEKMLAFCLIAQFAWVIFFVLPVPVHSHDALANYALKARIFFDEGGIPAGFSGGANPLWRTRIIRFFSPY